MDSFEARFGIIEKLRQEADTQASYKSRPRNPHGNVKETETIKDWYFHANGNGCVQVTMFVNVCTHSPGKVDFVHWLQVNQAFGTKIEVRESKSGAAEGPDQRMR